MASITINLDEIKDHALLAQISQTILQARGQVDITKFGSFKSGPEVSCPIPIENKDQSEADRLAGRQEYCFCLMASATKVLDTLQRELSKESSLAGAQVRDMMRDLTSGNVYNNYAVDSRHLLRIACEATGKQERKGD